MSIRSHLRCLVWAGLAGLVVFAGVAFAAMAEIEVNGPIYRQISLTQQIVTDYVPPPENLLEVALICNVINNLSDPVLSLLTSKFIDGAKIGDFTDLSNYIPTLGLPVNLVNEALALLQTTKITRITYDNSQLLVQLEKELEGLKKQTETMEKTLQLEERAATDRIQARRNQFQKESIQTVNQIDRSLHKLEDHYLKTLDEIASTPISTVNEAVLFSNPATRDILLQDEEMKNLAINLGLLISQNGELVWKNG